MKGEKWQNNKQDMQQHDFNTLHYNNKKYFCIKLKGEIQKVELTPVNSSGQF